MAIAVNSDVQVALQQPGVRPACLVTVDNSSGDVLRWAVDSITWSGVAYAARLAENPTIRVTPAAPERGILGGMTGTVTVRDGDGVFAALRPGYFEARSISVTYVVTDVESAYIRQFACRVTDVARPDLDTLVLNFEDALSSVRRQPFPSDPWLISNLPTGVVGLSSDRGGFGAMPSPQPHIEGANRCFPMMFGQCVAPCIVQWAASLCDVNSMPEPILGNSGATILYEPIFGNRNGSGFDVVQRWNDNYSQVASIGNTDNDPLDAGGASIAVRRIEVHSATPIHEGFQVVPIYYGGKATRLNASGDRHTVTPPEVAKFLVDSSFDGGPFGIAVPYDTTTSDSLDVAYRGIATAFMEINAGSASAIAWHGFHGFQQEQRPLEQWMGDLMHDGLLGFVWRDRLIPIALPFSRTTVASFTEANIVKGSLSWTDEPLSNLETTRTIFYRRQSRDVEPVTSYTWSAAANGSATSRVSPFIGHSIPAWRVAQFWSRREAYGRRRYTWRMGLFAFGMEQHDLGHMAHGAVVSTPQLVEVDAVTLLPDWTVQVQARESDYSLFTFTDTPEINWRPDLRFMQRVQFPQSSWALGTDGSSFQVQHALIGVPDAAAANYTGAQFATSYPSSLVTATASTAILYVTNLANSGAAVAQFETILLGWDLAKRG